ncbi:MAG: Crp/Fnr family transcriptional regulator [Burkholderiales bacterium]
MSSLSAFGSDLREVLERVGTAITKRRGEHLFEQGKPANGMYIIRTGHVALLAEQGYKRAYTQVAGPGELIGLPAVIASNRFSMSAEVLDDANLTFIPRDVVLNALSHSPDLCMQALDVLAREVQEMRRVLRAAKYAVN